LTAPAIRSKRPGFLGCFFAASATADCLFRDALSPDGFVADASSSPAVLAAF